jgi:FAD:protein FMN transferase
MVRVAVPQTLTRERVRPPAGRLTQVSGPTMGVAWTVTAVVPQGLTDPDIRLAAQAAVDQVVAQMSTWEPESDISRFNRADVGWREVPEALFSVVEAGLEIAGLTGGAFDPTLGALVDLWGFGAPGARTQPPAVASLHAARAGCSELEFDRRGRRLRQPGGLQLDLSGIAKGFGVDQLAAAMERLGLTSYLVEIGGELRGAGVKPSGEPWFVALERPSDADESLEPILVALADLSIASSGDWRRRFAAGGRTFSHTLDLSSRAPIDNGLAAVTVLHADCMRADAWCTALMVLGPQRGQEIAIAEGLAAAFLLRTPGGYVEQFSPPFQALLD